MKLPSKALSLQEQLQEFDIWITPSLREIRDTARFKQELDRIAAVFEALAAATDDFDSIDACQPAAIAATYTVIASESVEPGARFFDLASALFLVSGKSDNNAKCQLPIYLRDRIGRTTFPRVSSKGKVTEGPIPRVLKADTYMEVVARLSGMQASQKALLEAFVGFVLSDDGYTAQLWSVGRSFVAMKELGHERELLSPLVMFQVRGSVSASGGHVPENMLRALMGEWGLLPGSDFNMHDAIVGADRQAVEQEDDEDGQSENDEPEKTRAYDFVLPFRVPGWQPRLLIQSQFYAGDSGSVSHKNVDQTAKSRQSAIAILPVAKFVEYVDGAGYFASLNGDLKKLLAMPTTHSFLQVRTAPVRLRRELQAIGFLTPLEVAHAVLTTDGSSRQVVASLVGDGYRKAEVARAMEQALTVGMLAQGLDGAPLGVPMPRREVVRRYLLLDTAARTGTQLDPRRPGFKGQFLVPGYGPFHGLPLDELAKRAIAAAPSLKLDWSSPEVILGDIRWLCERGFAITA